MKNDLVFLGDVSANPGPLGLFGFGMTTVLLNLHNAGFYELNAMILAMGLFVGGTAQLIAGILESKKNNTFGLTAFVSYGCFWLSLVAIILMTKSGIALPSSSSAMGFYLAMWGIFTLILFVGSLRINTALSVVFVTLTILFFLLATAEWTGSGAIKIVAGYEGIFCGLSAIYLAAAGLLNEVYGEKLLPIGEANLRD
ncbi:acetate uptake transporter [Pedobacter sp. UYEF25]